MASRADLRAIEDDCPWLREDFQADLGLLRTSTAEAAVRFAEDARVLARLAAQVPRCPYDERGATPWTSFRREVAVARSISDQSAAAEIRRAVSLLRSLALLDAGRITVKRARTFIDELDAYDDELARQLDEQLAERVAGLPAWRIAQEVRRAAARLEPEAAALRTAVKNADRSVQLEPLADDQALVLVQGPAVPLTRWYETVTARARSLKQAGDPRTLAQLRFDLATSGFPCAMHVPDDPTQGASSGSGLADLLGAAGFDAPEAAGLRPGHVEAAAGLRPGHVEAASTDCRLSRPVQASIGVPVETALGLSNEPGWLDGYGWITAPTTRLLLVDAELRRVCTRTGTGELVAVADRDVRPPPTPDGVRHALRGMVLEPVPPGEAAWRVENQHDPSPPLRQLVALRDRWCDGPTGARVPASRCELDHDTPHPVGPTAAWNLRARSQRTHQLKHQGWTPLSTPSSTIWFSPAGQVVEVPQHAVPPPGVDDDPDQLPVLPDAAVLAAFDEEQLTYVEGPRRPWPTGWSGPDDAPPF